MTCPGKQTFPRMTMGLGTPEQAMACQLLKSSCVSYPKGLAPPALCRCAENANQPGFYVEPRIVPQSLVIAWGHADMKKPLRITSERFLWR